MTELAEPTWRCPSCDTFNSVAATTCMVCVVGERPEAPSREYFYPVVQPPPAAPPPPPPNPPRRSPARILFPMAAVLVILLFLGNLDHLVSLVHGMVKHGDAGATPVSTHPCPGFVAHRIPGTDTPALVAAYRTAYHDVVICRSSTGALHYYGQFINKPSTAMLIPAEQTSDGYLAHNDSYTYQVTSTEIIVTHAGVTLGTYTWHAYQP